MIYYPPAPKAVTEVVDPDHPERLVGCGQTGRVRLTTLTREFSCRGFLERDEAEREAPCDLSVGMAYAMCGRFRASSRKSSRSVLMLVPIATNHIQWDQPHQGNRFDHLYARRAFQRAREALAS